MANYAVIRGSVIENIVVADDADFLRSIGCELVVEAPVGASIGDPYPAPVSQAQIVTTQLSANKAGNKRRKGA